MIENEIGTNVVRRSVQIHKDLGPGLFESVYEAILQKFLIEDGYEVQRQAMIPIRYAGLEFDEGFKADLIVEKKVILELKSQESITDIHKKQLLTYLKLSGLKIGYLLNFGAALMKEGIVRIAN